MLKRDICNRKKIIFILTVVVKRSRVKKNIVIRVMEEERYVIHGPEPFEPLPNENLAQIFWKLLINTDPSHVIMVSVILWLTIFGEVNFRFLLNRFYFKN